MFFDVCLLKIQRAVVIVGEVAVCKDGSLKVLLLLFDGNRFIFYSFLHVTSVLMWFF